MKNQIQVAFSAIALASAALLAITFGQATSPSTLPAAKNPLTAQTAGDRLLGSHDPSAIIKCNDEYWIFYTGNGIPSAHSKDLLTWQPGPRVVETPAGWIAAAVPNNRRNDCWAPDVIKAAGKYMLYYAVSTFGSNVSAIGLTTNPTLDPADPNYHWTDQGIVIQSQRSDNFNAIDPAAAWDADGGLWLAFGSFWSGIKMIQLDPATGKRIAPDSRVYSLAHYSSIEASYVYHHDKYYYLFVNWGRCCQGVNSTYNIRVGRSEKITGPYLDKAGKDMLNDGGSLVLQSEDQFIGPGQTGIFNADGKEWFSFHYEADARRRVSLAIRPLSWDPTDWPVVERMPEQPPTTAPAGAR